MELSFLLDTNVIIQFEEVGQDRQIKDQFQKLHALLVEFSIPFKYHPLTKNDLDNDKDKDRLSEMLSRLKKYPCLEIPPTAEGPELEKLFKGIKDTNDLIDCQLLFALSRNCATYLISEDVKLHRRVDGTELEDRIFFVHEAADLIARKFKPESVQMPHVEHEYLYNLDITDYFFDSLKADYDGFEAWVKKTASVGRRCWTMKVEDELAGLCIYKHDDKIEHDGIPMPSMKLCTFKVAEKYEGQKFGEQLLKTAHHYAVKNKLAAMWVTTHEKQSKLIYFLKRFGFQVHADLKKKDMIFFKMMSPPEKIPPMDPLEYHILYSPHYYDDKEIQKFVIPIQSQFHDILFPEVAPRPTLPGIQTSEVIPGNTIRKVYLSHSRIKAIPSGSIIYFYRSSPDQYIQAKGIVEKARRLSDMDSLAAAIGKRSVYSREEVQKMIKKKVFVIDFRLIAHSENVIPLNELINSEVFNKRPPQSIMKLEHRQYLNLKKSWVKKNK